VSAPTPPRIIRANGAGPERIELAGGVACWYTRRCPGRPEERQNEDALLLAETAEGAVLAIADGAGGQAGSERAAEVALAALAAALQNEEGALRERILAGVEAANLAVRDLRVGAGATLALVQIAPEYLRSYHAGDSRVLLFGQRGKRKFASLDHSPVGYAVEAGVLREGEALHHEERHFVSNLMGADGFRLDMSGRLVMARHDTLLIASDGLIDNLTSDEIVDLARRGPIKRAVERLASLATHRMGNPESAKPSKPDDLTLLLYRRKAPRPPEAPPSAPA
jgi:serine/threonine protein phosphatase PrpC